MKRGCQLKKLNDFNEKWMAAVNATGKAFFSHTKLNGKYIIRWVIGQTDVEEKHISAAWVLLKEQLLNIKNQELPNAK